MFPLLFRIGCLDTLAAMQELKMGVASAEEETQAVMKVYSKEDYSVVNRFESKCVLSAECIWSNTENLKENLSFLLFFSVLCVCMKLSLSSRNCDQMIIYCLIFHRGWTGRPAAVCSWAALSISLCAAAGHGGGWGYSAHSVEAIRFCADADILLGGLGLFGGRGEYTAKIKVGSF